MQPNGAWPVLAPETVGPHMLRRWAAATAAAKRPRAQPYHGGVSGRGSSTVSVSLPLLRQSMNGPIVTWKASRNRSANNHRLYSHTGLSPAARLMLQPAQSRSDATVAARTA